jgi:hypothetical protein
MQEVDEMVNEMQHELTNFDVSLRNGHKSIQQITKMMDSLVIQIQSANSVELKSILGNVKDIAKRYRNLEYDTISLVKNTSVVAEDVRTAAQGAIDDELTTAEAFESMNKDFEGLSNSMTKALECHSDIAKELRDQAEESKKAKGRNDQLQATALERKEDAEIFGLMAIPGACLLATPVMGASRAAARVDNKALKVVAGAGGAIGGLVGGVLLTALTPIFAAWAIRCAVLGSGWSETFQDLSDRILSVEAAINGSALHLSCIRSMLTQLDEKVSKCDASKSKGLLRIQFKKILNSCTKLEESCNQYLLSLQSTKNNQEMLSTSNNMDHN